MTGMEYNMKLSQFKFKLPEERIAQYPAPFRDECRLMVLHTKSGVIEHRDHFYDIIDDFDDQDVFVLNDTKVFPARLEGNKEKTVPKSRSSSCGNSIRSSAFGMSLWNPHAKSVSATSSTLEKTSQWWLKSSTTPPAAAAPSASSTMVLTRNSKRRSTPSAKHPCYAT